MVTFKEYYDNELKKSNILRLYKPIDELLQRELSDSKIASTTVLVDELSLKEVREKYNFEDIENAIGKAIYVQKVLSDADIPECYLYNMYADCDLTMFRLILDIDNIYEFIVRLIKVKYGIELKDYLIELNDLLELVHIYRKDRYCDISKLSKPAIIRNVCEMYKHAMNKVMWSSINKIIESYIYFTYKDIDKADIKEICSSVMLLLLNNGKEALLFKLLNNGDFLLNKDVYKGNSSVLASVVNSIAESYKILMDC